METPETRAARRERRCNCAGYNNSSLDQYYFLQDRVPNGPEHGLLCPRYCKEGYDSRGSQYLKWGAPVLEPLPEVRHGAA